MKARTRRALLVLVLSSWLGACGTSPTPTPGTDDVRPSTTTQDSSTTHAAAPTTTIAVQPEPDEGDWPTVDWSDPDKVARLEDGWSVAACEGDAPLLCVERDGAVVGAVEAVAFPVESLDWFDSSASSDDNLAALAEEFVQAIGADRATGCGSDYVFDPFAPEPFVLANTPGIFFGFKGTMPDGRPSELNLQYATLVEDRIVSVVAAAYDEGGCPGPDEMGGFTTGDLAEFRPHLEAVLHESALPSLRE